MRPRIRTLLAVLLYCAATSCGGHAGVRLRTTAQADVVRALGSRIVDLLARPDSVRSFLLSREQVPTHLGRPDAVAMWKIQRLGPLLGPTEVDTLRSLAFSSASYLWETKACTPTPGVGFKFYSSSGQLDVAMCFECGMWIFATNTTARGENFDSAAPELTRIAQRLFPDLHLSMSEASRMKKQAEWEKRQAWYRQPPH